MYLRRLQWNSLVTWFDNDFSAVFFEDDFRIEVTAALSMFLHYAQIPEVSSLKGSCS